MAPSLGALQINLKTAFPQFKLNKPNYLIAIAPAIIVLVFDPYLSFNGFARFKIYILSILLILVIGKLRLERKLLTEGITRHKMFFVSLGYFAIGLILTIIFNSNHRLTQLFGDLDRATSVASYLIIILLAILIYLIKLPNKISAFIYALFISGLLVEVYAATQVFSLDPVQWVFQKDWVFSTLGNPNHLSAFLAINFFINLYLLVNKFISKAFYFNLFIILYLMIENGSLQGFVILIMALLIIALQIFIRANRSTAGFIAFVLLPVIGLIGIFMGLFSFGPAQVLYQDASFLRRKELWTAGFQMFLDSPLTGHGMGAYRYLFLSYRSNESVLRVGESRGSNSAHSELIDLAVGGGIILASAWLFLLMVTIWFSYRLIKSQSEKVFGPSFVLVVIYLGSIIHNLVSAPSIAISVLQFSSMALIFYKTYDLSDRRPANQSVKSNKVKQVFSLPKYQTVALRVLLLMGVAPYLLDLITADAIVSKNIARIESMATVSPLDLDRSAIAIEALLTFGYVENAARVADISIENFPKSTELLELAIQIPERENLNKQYLDLLRKLNPYYEN